MKLNVNTIQGKRIPRSNLTPSKDYRAITSDFFVYLQRIHGGGPSILRIDQSIYSSSKDSFISAVIRVQRSFRAHQQYMNLCIKAMRLSASSPSANLGVFSESGLPGCDEYADSLHEIASFTQEVWKGKRSHTAINAIASLLVTTKV